jgi:hypothetical protein
VDRELEDRSRVGVDDVGAVVAHEAAVVGEAARHEQGQRVRRELPGGRAVAGRVAQERPQGRQPHVDLGLLGGRVELVRGEVVMAVMADLVAAVDDRADRLGVALRGGARDVEGPAHPVLAEQVQDPRQPAPDAELVLGQRAEAVPARLELGADPGLGVHVEGEADRGHGGILADPRRGATSRG